MTAPDGNEGSYTEDLQMLTFTLMGTKMGVDTAQLDGIIKPDEAVEAGLDVTMFHERVPFRGGPVIYSSPMVLMVKDPHKPYGVMIEEPDDLISVSIDSIHELPSLVASCSRTKAIWGAVLKDEDVVLLVDFYSMQACKSPETAQKDH